MFSYSPHFFPTSIVLIGAGGTGSRLMPALGQLVKSSLRRHNPGAFIENCDIYVIDGDVVEHKNLARQNFIQQDVGRNKAVVVAERYARAYGINIIPCPEFLRPDTAASFEGPAGSVPYHKVFENSIVIFAVDSAKARKEILKFMDTYCTQNLFVVDAGNEDDFGQVKFFTGHALYSDDEKTPEQILKGFPKDGISVVPTNFIPMDFEYYENLGDSAAERSCAELPQTLAINNMMSALMLGVIQNFLQLRSMNYDGLNFSLQGAMSTNYNLPHRWAKRVIRRSTRTAAFNSFIAKKTTVISGSALTSRKGEDEMHDIFYRLRQEQVKDYRGAGAILKNDGTLELIPPPTPAAPVVTPPIMPLVAKVPAPIDEDWVAPTEIPPLRPMGNADTDTLELPVAELREMTTAPRVRRATPRRIGDSPAVVSSGD